MRDVATEDPCTEDVKNECDAPFAEPEDNPLSERDELNIDDGPMTAENFKVNEELEYLMRFRNATFSWRLKENAWLEIDDLDIPSGKFAKEKRFR